MSNFKTRDVWSLRNVNDVKILHKKILINFKNIRIEKKITTRYMTRINSLYDLYWKSKRHRFFSWKRQTLSSSFINLSFFFVATKTQSFFSNEKRLIKFENKFQRSKKFRKNFDSFDNDKFRRSITRFDKRKKTNYEW